MSCTLALEKLTYIIRGSADVFSKIWTLFIQFVNNKYLKITDTVLINVIVSVILSFYS